MPIHVSEVGGHAFLVSKQLLDRLSEIRRWVGELEEYNRCCYGPSPSLLHHYQRYPIKFSQLGYEART